MVDSWQFRPNDAAKGFKVGMDKNYQDDDANRHNMETARNNAISVADPSRVHLVQDFSAAAATRFPDSYFDWIYIDAMHDYENVIADLNAWWPKRRPGGFFTGDDYGDSVDLPNITHKRYTRKF